jgi:hypothetical protein
LAAAGDFELAENQLNVLFHRRQTQPGVIGDFSRASFELRDVFRGATPASLSGVYPGQQAEIFRF